MAQRIGLESTLEGKAFQRGVSEYLGGLNKMQSETANVGSSINSTLSKIGSAAGGSVGGLGKLASGLGGIATVAGGIVAANLFNKMAEGIGAFVSTGLEAVDSAQRLETGLGALLSMNNMYERQTETITVATKSAKEWADEQLNAAAKADDLAFKQRQLTAEINTQNASIQEQRQRIIQMADGLDKNQQVARLAEMELALEGMNRELAEAATEQGKLSNIQQEYTTTTRTSFEQTMNLADAQKLAAAQSKDLLSFVEKLSIVSPFEQDQVALVSKLAVAAGLGVEQTKSFTAGFLDLAAAVGIGSESLDFAADQLLQVAKVGKITSVDLRQLRRLGIDLEKIIGTQMGMSIEEFNEKAAKSPEVFNELFDSVTKFSQNTFAGTAEKMATSLSGLKSTFSDIFSVSAKNLLRPIVEAVSPLASSLLGQLSTIATGPELAQLGQNIGAKITEGIAFAQEAIGKIMGAFEQFGLRGASVSILGMLGFDPIQIGAALSAVDQVIAAIGRIKTAFETFGARGAAFSILSLMGLDSDSMVAINNAIGSTISYITEQFNTLVALLQPSIASFQESFTRLGLSFGTTTPSIEAFTNGLSILANFLVETLIPAWVQWIGFLAGAAATAFSAWVTYVQAVKSAWEGLSLFVQESLIPALLSINEAMTPVINLLVSVGGVINAVTNKALQAMVGLWQNALFPALQKVGDILNGVMFPVFQDLGKTLSSDVSPALSDLGEEILPLIMEGMDYVSEAIKRATSYFNALKESINSFSLPDILTPGSPPPLAYAFTDIASGANAAGAAVEGMMNNLASSKWSDIQGKVFDLVDDFQDEGFYAKLGFGKATGNAIKHAFGRAFNKNFGGIMSGVFTDQDLLEATRREAGAYAERVFGPAFTGLTEKAREAGTGMMAVMQQELRDALPGIASTLSNLAGGFVEMIQEQNKAPDGGDLSKIGLLQEFLQGGEESMVLSSTLQDMEGLLSFTIDRNQAQEELNKLLAKQAEQERQIAKQQESQKQLSFLQMQVDLLKQGQALGVNVFEGLKFGLDASADDLLNATNAVVEAMVNQINTTLQISSPSKVMARIGQNVGAGLAKGVEASRGLVTSAMSHIMPAGAGVSNSYNRTQNMPVTINNYGGQPRRLVSDITMLRARVSRV